MSKPLSAASEFVSATGQHYPHLLRLLRRRERRSLPGRERVARSRAPAGARVRGVPGWPRNLALDRARDCLARARAQAHETGALSLATSSMEAPARRFLHRAG